MSLMKIAKLNKQRKKVKIRKKLKLIRKLNPRLNYNMNRNMKKRTLSYKNLQIQNFEAKEQNSLKKNIFNKIKYLKRVYYIINLIFNMTLSILN